MSFDNLDEIKFDAVKKALLLLGWKVEYRSTTEDVRCVEEITENTNKLYSSSKLTEEKTNELSYKIFEIFEYQVMSPEERSAMMESAYSQSKYFSSLIAFVDEAILCYYRGYYTSSLATLFILVESYLLNLLGWKKGTPKPSFKSLKGAMNILPSCIERDDAAQILDVIYSFYDPANPTHFNFNRHGLLHGLRGSQEMDMMNCARIFQFFDLLCFAEGLGRGFIVTEPYRFRLETYKNCDQMKRDTTLLGHKTILTKG